MTFGEKLTALRSRSRLSQEQLAERLQVSRQSVSKWEVDAALPQTDKVLMIADVFGVSTDTLLKPELPVFEESPVLPAGVRYFGPDGFRGCANRDITAVQAFAIGRYVGWYCTVHEKSLRAPGESARILLGKDTRRSSYMFEYALAAGITAAGADVYILHVTTAPSVSYVVRNEGFDCGIMISASHNRYADNGIRLIDRQGTRPEPGMLQGLEDYLDGLPVPGCPGGEPPLAVGEHIGRMVDHVAGRNRYMGYLISIAAHSYRNMKVGLDCADGAAWMIAQSVFNALGATVVPIHVSPDGTNINRACGSTCTADLQALVTEKHLDVGFAFDGDADRCIAVDEQGRAVVGDQLLYILARRLKHRGALDRNTVVMTVMSNTGLTEALDRAGIGYVRTPVGDRNVYAEMLKNGYRLGGEQSGHIILQKYATTGDGILTAIMIMEELMDSKCPLSRLVAPVVMRPQLLRNVPVKSKAACMADPEVQRVAEQVAGALTAEGGRLVFRASETEPVVRIMTECSRMETCGAFCDRIAAVIEQRGHKNNEMA